MSKVVFDEESHIYTLDGKRLSGITAVIKKHLFPDEYKDVPEKVLQAAAERGHAVHDEVSHWVEGFPYSSVSEETKALMQWAGMNGVEFRYSEFLVTDGENYASAVDLIDINGDIYDIKTTYTLNKEYVRWQLSIYAYMLELQCGHTPSHLYALHLKGGECECIEVERIPAEHCKALLDAEVRGEVFVNPLAVPITAEAESMIAVYREAEEAVRNLKAELDAKERAMNSVKEGLLSLMLSKGVKKWETDGIRMTVKEAYERKSVDSKALQEQMPEVYNQFLKTSRIKESLTITIK